MAEAVVAIVAEGLKPLGDFIIQQANFLSGVSGQVEFALTELQFMYGFLKDADAKQEDNEVVRIWVANIRDAAYDLEDVIETFVLKVASKRRGSKKIVLKRYVCIFKEGCYLHKIGSDIEQITKKISKLRLSLQNYNIKEIRGSEGVACATSSKDRRLSFPHVMERDVVGIQDNIEALAKNLVKEEEKCHKVLSIWGMGGSGKTTLAKHVYHHNEVRRYFDCFAWVCISHRCQGRDVLEEILVKLKSATKVQREEIEKLKTDEIAEQLCIMQKESKCLVVVDDIWTLDAWNSLEAGFPIKDETQSRVLLTTRNKEVALHASGNGFLYQPQPLNETESWELFEKITLSGRHSTDPETYAKKEELGKMMLPRCKGLPLAITVLAGVLSRKNTVEEWDIARENVDVYIRKGRVLERGNKGQEYEGTSWVLALSYDNLPYRLKLCFLYLRQFPEDYEIPVKRLTQLWMAEGLILLSSTDINIMEDVAYNCLNELVERCMVQVGKHGSTKKIKTCRLHDLIRDLCVLKAKEENFLDVIHFSEAIASREAPIGKVRRLAIYLDKEVDQLAPTRDAQLRSLLYFVDPEYYFQNRSARLIHPILEDFKFLRVLKFEDIGGDVELPSTIGNLVHLRFLSLKNSNIKRLPSSVSNLICLQTLDLRCFDWDFLKMQNVFGKMEQLRHLYLPGRHKVSEKLSLASLRNLQTLVNVSSEDFDLNDLVELTSLRKLVISAPGLTPLKHLEEILEYASITFKHLLSLSVEVDSGSGVIPTNIVLRCPHLYKLRLHGRITELPQHFLCYPNLTKMTLQGTGLAEDQREILEKLPNLRILYLGFYAFRSETIVFSEGGFPRLEFLSLDWWWQLKEWRVEKGSMPSLRRLHIEDCSALRELPDGLQYVFTLKEIIINFMYREFCSKSVEGGEDFYKIKHVPSVIITNITFTEEPDQEMQESTTIVEVDGAAAESSFQIRTKEENEPERELLAVSEVVDAVEVAEEPTMDNEDVCSRHILETVMPGVWLGSTIDASGKIDEIQAACS